MSHTNPKRPLSDEIYEFKVVGYDQNGYPLYQRVSATSNNPSIETHRSSANPAARISKRRGHYDYMSPELIELKHNRSVKQYPDLGIENSDREFVIKDIRRTPLGAIGIAVVDVLLCIILIVVWAIIASHDSFLPSLSNGETIISSGTITTIFLLLIFVALIFGWVAIDIYRANRIIITSERVIQHIAKGLFDRKTQSVDYNNIEDVSYHKFGVMASVLDFGNVKLSTIGDESTYRLTMVRNPEEVSNELNQIVQAIRSGNKIPEFKN